jgi:SAM-dependent methyltransferase
MADWEKRYQEGEHANDEPEPLVIKFVSTLAPGRALDVASGPGRHAVWLARRGWDVTAVDSSRTAMHILQKRSLETGVPVNTRIADLERHEFVIERECYDLIIVCNYLQRDLFPAIRAGTRIGGTVVAIIPMVDNDPEVRPMNASYLLNPGELRAYLQGWELIHDFEGKREADAHRRAKAEMVAVRVKH